MSETTKVNLEWHRGDRMRKAREHAGVRSHEEMARLLADHGIQVRHTSVSNWERGKQPRDLMRVVDAWSEITGVSAAWLLGINPDGTLPLCSFVEPVVAVAA